MSNYNYYQSNQSSLVHRYDTEHQTREGYGINGLGDWHRLISRLLAFLGRSEDNINPDRQGIRRDTIGELLELSDNDNFRDTIREGKDPYNRSTEELIAMLLLIRLRKLYRPLSTNGCPRLFVSHRQTDKAYGLRMAQIALNNKFAFWLDVLDPDLASLKGSAVPEKLIPLMTACIIEMALINCTHVVACMTKNSSGTLWIPYEYGRIRELPGVSVNTCAWLHPDLVMPDLPEYMMLGEIVGTEDMLKTWLQVERTFSSFGSCIPQDEDFAALGAIARLPEVKGEEIKRKKAAYMQRFTESLALSRQLPIKRLRFKKNRGQ